MLTWHCKNCRLRNKSSKDKCIACFQPHPHRFWQCVQCNLINKVTNIRCVACSTIQTPKFVINNKWSFTYLNPSPSMDNNIKMIEWNDKLYTIVLCPELVKDKESSKIRQIFDIKMIDHSISEIDHKPTNILSSHVLPDIHAMDMTSCVNRKKAELYMVILYRQRANRYYKCLLIIYDLNKQKNKQQQYINFDNKMYLLNISKIYFIINI